MVGFWLGSVEFDIITDRHRQGKVSAVFTPMEHSEAACSYRVECHGLRVVKNPFVRS